VLTIFSAQKVYLVECLAACASHSLMLPRPQELPFLLRFNRLSFLPAIIIICRHYQYHHRECPTKKTTFSSPWVISKNIPDNDISACFPENENGADAGCNLIQIDGSSGSKLLSGGKVHPLSGLSPIDRRYPAFP
jgi:hypothetical protein